MYDAIILSYVGIKFLKFENEISEIFSTEEIIFYEKKSNNWI